MHVPAAVGESIQWKTLLPSLETSPNKKLVPIPVKRARAVQHKRVGGRAALLAVKGGHRPHLRKFQLKSF